MKASLNNKFLENTELSKRIEQVLSLFPTIKASGTDFSIEDTANIISRDVIIKGNAEQDTTTGKNYLNVPSNYSFSTPDIPINLSAGTYHFTCAEVIKGGENSPVMIVNNQSYSITSNMDRTIAINNDMNNFKLFSNGWSYPQSKDVSSIVNNFMISQEGGEYEPFTGNKPSPSADYPQDIRVVIGDNTVKIYGKNLFDKNNPYEYIEVEAGTTYTLSGVYDTGSGKLFSTYNSLYVLNDEFEIRNRTFTTKNGTKFLKFNSNSIDNQFLNTIQIEKGSQATEYDSPQNFEITLGNLELCKIEDYQDYIYRENGKWYKHKEIGKVILDGSEEITLNNVGENTQFYKVEINAKGFVNNNINLNNLSNCYISIRNNYADMENNKFSISTSGDLIICDTIHNTVNNFKDYLFEKKPVFVIKLATPTEEEITDITLINQLNDLANFNSYDEQTNIFVTGSDSNADMILDVTLIKNPFKKLDELEERLAILETT